MVYVGGIAVMFLFLIMIIEVNFENITRKQKKNLNISYYLLVSFIAIFLYAIYSILFNIVPSLDAINTHFISSNFLNNSDFNDIFLISTNLDDKLLAYNMSDIESINKLFEYKPAILLFISIYLMIATFISLILCSNPFEKFIDF
jgi:uncharacterized protein with PQ loop repeat